MSDVCRLCGGRPDAKVARAWTLFVPIDAPSQNNHVVNAGTSRWRYAKERSKWVVALNCAATSAGAPDAVSFRRVTFERCYAGKQRIADHANIIGGLKLVVDAMVLCGLLVDDDPKHFEAHYRQRRGSNEERGTFITIEELA